MEILIRLILTGKLNQRSGKGLHLPVGTPPSSFASLRKQLSSPALLATLLLIVLLPLGAQTTSKTEAFKLIHSDKLFLNRLNNEQVLELSGKVHFWYGKTEFKSDRAMIFDTQKIARLSGRVSVVNDSLGLKADSVAYYRSTEDLNLGGKVQITESRKTGSLRWFKSEYAIYNRKADKLTVWKDVSAWDKDENAWAECGYAYWDRKAGYAYMIENPRLRSGVADTLYIKADKIEFFDAERKIVATFNAEVKSQDYLVNSDFLIYMINEEKAVFTGRPSFLSDYAKASANEFYLYLKERKLQRAELQDSCRVSFSEERGGIQDNWVTAGFISIGFREEAIKEFTAEDEVVYYYAQAARDKRDPFVNTARGYFLEAKFNDDNKLELMRMARGVKGSYKFQNNP